MKISFLMPYALVLFLGLLGCQEAPTYNQEVAVNDFDQSYTLKEVVDISSSSYIDSIKTKLDLNQSKRLSESLDFNHTYLTTFTNTSAKYIVIPITKSSKVEKSLFVFINESNELTDLILVNEIQTLDKTLFLSNYYSLDGSLLMSAEVNDGNVTFKEIEQTPSKMRLKYCFLDKFGECGGSVFNQMTDGSLMGTSAGIGCLYFGAFCGTSIIVGCSIMGFAHC